MPETKSESFHRLATKRVETIEDALRIFSNLSGPNYDWDQAEVEAYFGRISAAQGTALQRFCETKRWQVSEPEEAPAPPAAAPSTAREVRMIDIWHEAGEDAGALAEMVAMQGEVITNMQRIIDALSTK